MPHGSFAPVGDSCDTMAYFDTLLFLPRLVWLLVKMVFYLIVNLPMLQYSTWVLLTGFVIYAAHDKRVPAEMQRIYGARKPRLALTVLMSIVVEVPLYVAVIKVLGILTAKVFGLFSSYPGTAVLLLDLASIALLVTFYTESLTAVDKVLSQVADTSQPDDQAFESLSLLQKSLSPIWLESGERDVQCYYNIGYFGASDLRDNSVKRLTMHDEGMLDILTTGWPTTAKRPVVIYVHGGGWNTGHKDQLHTFPKILAERGFVVANINYRLCNKFPQPAGIKDVKKAICWVRSAISAFGGDPEYILLAGDSAGGHLAQLAALTPNDGYFQDIHEADAADPKLDTTVQGTLLIAPALDVGNHFGIPGYAQRKRWFTRFVCEGDDAVAQRLDPVALLNEVSVAAMPPCLIFHGSHDSLVSPRESKHFQERCVELGGGADKVKVVSVPGMHHASHMFHSPRTIAISHVAADWALAKWQSATGAKSAVPTTKSV